MADIHFTCPKCNQAIDAPAELANQLIDCPTCKETIEVPIRTSMQTPDFSSRTISASENEHIFFQSGNILVTNARFVVGEKTFAMRTITSVQSNKRETEEAPPIITGIADNSGTGCLLLLAFMVGLFAAIYGYCISSIWLEIVGGLLVAGGFWLAMRLRTSEAKPKRKTMFAVVLTTASGELTACESDDQEHIAQIIRAVNDSIISHG